MDTAREAHFGHNETFQKTFPVIQHAVNFRWLIDAVAGPSLMTNSARQNLACVQPESVLLKAMKLVWDTGLDICTFRMGEKVNFMMQAGFLFVVYCFSNAFVLACWTCCVPMMCWWTCWKSSSIKNFCHGLENMNFQPSEHVPVGHLFVSFSLLPNMRA